MKSRNSSRKSLKAGWGCALALLAGGPCFGKLSGTSAFSFLNIPTGARATGMGQSFTSVPNDIQGAVYNPALLATLTASQASFQHLNYVADITQEGLAWGYAGREEKPSWGVTTNYFRVGKIERTVASLSSAGDGYTTVGDFSTYDMMLGVSGAKQFRDGFSAGAAVKLLRESLSDASSNGAAMDFGVLLQGTNDRAWNIGASLLNLGGASKFADAAVRLPWTARLGLSTQPFAQWLFAADFVKRNDTDGEVDVGVEVTPKRLLALRMGYRYMLKNPDYGGLSDFTGGLGFRFKKMSLDYAFAPLGDLGSTHRVSFNLRLAAGRTK